jgi:uncharacterized membrane protein YdjX (TVP38/TMEM64 family)
MPRSAGRALRIVGGLAVVAALIGLGRSGVFEWAIDAVAALGPWALPTFLVLYVLSVIAFVPSLLPNVAAGVLFGFTTGVAVSLVGAGLGAGITFGIGRLLGRGWLERRFGGDARFHSLMRLASERGWRIIVLARLTPIFPFAVANYAFGLTRMRARDYGLASMLGSIPSTLVLVSLGAAVGTLGVDDAGRERSPAEWALIALGVVATVALLWLMRRIARDALADLPPVDSPEPDSHDGASGCDEGEARAEAGAEPAGDPIEEDSARTA